MKKIGIILLCIWFHTSAVAQNGLIKRLLSNEKDTTRSASFLPIPVAGYSQEKGFEFGVGAIYAFFVDKKDTLNRSSTLTTTLTYSTKKTYNLSLSADVWTKANQTHLMGELKIRKIPFNFYGIGNNTIKSDEDQLERNEFKTLLEAEKRIVGSWYSGVSLGYDDYRIKDKISGGVFSQLTDPNRAGSNALFIGLSETFDNRNSNNYPTRGTFARLTYQYAPKLSRTANFHGSQLVADIRGFISLSQSFVLAIQGYYATIQSNSTPFYRLQQLGSDERMRGYYSGRYRDENQLSSQIELRYRYNNRFGAVAFVGAGTVFGFSKFNMNQFKPNYGGGLRYFFDAAKGLSLRVDYGLGEKRNNEKRQAGLYISLAEAF